MAKLTLTIYGVITNRMWFEKTDDNFQLEQKMYSPGKLRIGSDADESKAVEIPEDGSGLQANCGFEEATNSDGRWRVLSLFYAHVATLSGKKTE